VADRVIPQRELRNNMGAVLRAAEAVDPAVAEELDAAEAPLDDPWPT
jgi:hypothetical protein